MGYQGGCATVVQFCILVPPCSHSIYYSEVYNHFLLVSDVVYRPFTVITSYYGNNLCQIDIIRTGVSVHDLFGDRRIFKSRHLVVG